MAVFNIPEPSSEKDFNSVAVLLNSYDKFDVENIIAKYDNFDIRSVLTTEGITNQIQSFKEPSGFIYYGTYERLVNNDFKLHINKLAIRAMSIAV